MKPTEFLKNWLTQTPSPWKIGQVQIRPGFDLYHFDDHLTTSSLHPITIEELSSLVKTNSQGEFRPLRASPDLASGWILASLTLEELVLALRILYPSALSHWSAWSQNQLPITPYQETAERQTGMYHCTRLLTVEQRTDLTQTVCAPGCLKKRLWEPADPVPLVTQEIPLLCAEACNFFIPKAREVVKSMMKKPV